MDTAPLQAAAQPRWGLWIASLFALALAVRLLALAVIPPQFWEYEVIATNLLEGNGFVYPHLGTLYRSYCEPLYPALAAFVYFLTEHNVLALQVVQALLSAGLVVVIYHCARAIISPKTALLAAAFVALHPGLIVYATKLHPLTLDALGMSLVLLMMIRVLKHFRLRDWIGAALVSGICALTRPTILVFLPLAFVYIFRVRKVGLGLAARRTLLFVAVLGLVIAPWIVRNYRVQGEFVLTRSNTPYVFWLGNNENFSGSALSSEREDIFNLADPVFKAQIFRLNEMEQNKLFWKRAMGYVTEHPVGFLIRVAKKFYFFWWFTPQAGLLYPKLWFLLYKLFYLLVLAGVLVGARSFFRDAAAGSARWLPILLMLSIAVIQSLAYIETRHRWAVEPVLLILTAQGLQQMGSWLAVRRGKG